MASKASNTTGFTLIELIVVIAIVAILVTIVAVAINPAEQLARARDSKRVSDLDAIRAALNLYAAQATTTPNLSGDATINDRCKDGSGVDTYFVNTAGSPSAPTGFTTASSTAQGVCTTAACATTASWLPALIGSTPGGSPISNMPLDPSNGTGNSTVLYYAFACKQNDRTYELTARLESTYYKDDLNLDGTDGGEQGSTSTAYEVGTNLRILLGDY